jgi:ATP-dependent Lon protease
MFSTPFLRRATDGDHRAAGYTEEEKVQIAKNYLVPRGDNSGLRPGSTEFQDSALHHISATIRAKPALESDGRSPASRHARRVLRARIHVWLSMPCYRGTLGSPKSQLEEEVEERVRRAGVAIDSRGLPSAATFCRRATVSKEDVISRLQARSATSAQSTKAALTWVRSYALELDRTRLYKDTDVHIHVPAGSIPKDGPSAGVTMVTALVSALTNVPIRRESR